MGVDRKSYSKTSPVSRQVRRSGRVSYVQPSYYDSQPEVSPRSSVVASPKASPGFGLRRLFQYDDDDIGDEIVVGGSRPASEPSATSGRSLRRRIASSSNLIVAKETPTSSRRSSGRIKPTASKETLKIQKGSPREKQADPALTSRKRIREEIASVTKVNQDSFLFANKEYFLPLLPRNNYISKLEESRGTSGDNPISPYRLLDTQPIGVKAVMKPYQLSGLSFLVHMYENGMSAMLGDEMGLGKTLQTLSLFQYLEEHGNSAKQGEELRPYLVVCPLSVLSSWVAEARKFTPELRVLRYHGPVSERQRLKKVAMGQEDWYGNQLERSKSARGRRPVVSKTNMESTATNVPFHLMITTYETFQAEQSWFKTAFVWKYVVLDEGHKIKNNVTQVASALQGLKAEYRLILTGTPLQNNLYEMWALLHWLYPDVFSNNTSDLFKDSFDLSHGKVTTSVLDHSRRLLELIMLRRMKDSPGVDLGLPPKTEVLLYVPLTPMQRFWYTRLLTKAGDGLLDDLFKGLRTKEKDALAQEANSDDTMLQKLETLDRELNERPDEWNDTKEIIRQSLAQEQQDMTTQGAWQKLNNLVIQLRKCCSHPYLLPGAAPEPYHLGEHVIRASGKFIVLEKLLRELVVNQNQKVLVFSEFTKVLGCTEDLLHLIGGDGALFRYMRLDGRTSRARRNLNIRLFNDMSSPYRVMLISTKAGGLGINLTSANNVIFLDETWNPQLTLQAEARAHRIGQTKPVTIYKLSTQGTVEEQMLGRIRKKLYLSAKITESMRSLNGMPGKTSKRGKPSADENMPQLDTTQLKSLIRRGAQTLSHPEIDVTEMLTWDIDTILEKCKDKTAETNTTTADAVIDEEKWLSAMEKVETAVFDGKRYMKKLEKEETNGVLPDDVLREDRRKGKNTTVMVDGFAVSKISMQCEDWEAVPTLAGKDPRLADVKRERKPDVVNQEYCQVCWDGGEIVCCNGCPRSYHMHCLPKPFQSAAGGWKQFYCPQHECIDCSKKTTDAGGLIFRCRWCEKGYCEDCLDWSKTSLVGDNLIEFEVLDFPAIDQAFYISCPECNELHEDEQAREFRDSQLSHFEAQHATHLASVKADREDEAPAPSVDGSLTSASTLVTNSGVSTPITPLEIEEPVQEGYVTRKRRANTQVTRRLQLNFKIPRIR